MLTWSYMILYSFSFLSELSQFFFTMLLFVWMQCSIPIAKTASVVWDWLWVVDRWGFDWMVKYYRARNCSVVRAKIDLFFLIFSIFCYPWHLGHLQRRHPQRRSLGLVGLRVPQCRPAMMSSYECATASWTTCMARHDDLGLQFLIPSGISGSTNVEFYLFQFVSN